MGLEKSIEKLDKYYKRLKKGKAQQIKPSHVEKVIRKLKTKEQSLLAELADTKKDTKIKSLNRKLDLVSGQQERAQWLLEEVSGS